MNQELSRSATQELKVADSDTFMETHAGATLNQYAGRSYVGCGIR